MTGYVRPLRCELRLREWDEFRAAYCGLCHALARRYGFLSRFLLGYDYTVLSLALSAYSPPGTVCLMRCPASPFRRKPCRGGPSADLAADLTVLLSLGRLRDTVADESWFKGLPARVALLFLSRAGRRAARRQPDVHVCVIGELARLRVIEAEHTAALDPAADTFARMLSHLAHSLSNEDGRRVLGRLFYHLGRWVYLMDACDDLPRDAKSGAYNPVAARFGLPDGQMTEEVRETVRRTARLSRQEIEAALALMPCAPAVPLLENIFLLGLPHVERQVLAGTWRKKHERPL